MTRPILELYTESTDGSNIEAKDSALVRHGCVALFTGLWHCCCATGSPTCACWPTHGAASFVLSWQPMPDSWVCMLL